jgi:hypothetical protein
MEKTYIGRELICQDGRVFVRYSDNPAELEEINPRRIQITAEARDPLRTDFAIAMQEGFLWLAQQKMSGAEWSVFAYLVSVVGFDNWLLADNIVYSKDFKADPGNFNSTVRKLIARGVLLRMDHPAKGNFLRINSQLLFRGKLQNQVAQASLELALCDQDHDQIGVM